MVETGCLNHLNRYKPSQPSLAQLPHIADQYGIAVEVDEVVFSQVVQDGGDRLAGSAGEIGNVLLRKAVLEQGLEAHAAAPCVGRVFQEINDARPRIFKNEGLQFLLHREQPLADDVQNPHAESMVGPHQLLKSPHRYGTKLHVLVHGDGRFVAVRFAHQAQLAEHGNGVQDGFDDLPAVIGNGAGFYGAVHQKVNVFGRVAHFVKAAVPRNFLAADDGFQF